jgi:hypothetical protein
MNAMSTMFDSVASDVLTEAQLLLASDIGVVVVTLIALSVIGLVYAKIK